MLSVCSAAITRSAAPTDTECGRIQTSSVSPSEFAGNASLSALTLPCDATRAHSRICVSTCRRGGGYLHRYVIVKKRVRCFTM